MATKWLRLAFALWQRARACLQQTKRRNAWGVPVHMLHIGKTGGTAVKTALGAVAAERDLRLPNHDVRLAHVAPGEKVFFFTRDPLDRFVSGFFSRKRQGRPRYDRPWSPGEELAFTHFATPNDLGLALSCADASRRHLAAHAMQQITHVNSSYWDWFQDEEYFLSRLDDVIFIGRQEILGADFQLLKKLLWLPAEIALPTDAVQAHVNPGLLDKNLGPEASRNLQAWYRREYDFLRLCDKIRARQKAA